MALGKTYSTKYLADSNNNTGAANQVLVSTATGIDWVDGSASGIIGGPYLALSGGTMTGNLGVGYAAQSNIRTFIYENSSNYTLAVQQDGTGIPFQVTSGGSVRLIVANNGNVGIGTDEPGAKLHVHTDTDDAYAIRIEGSTNNGAGIWTGLGIGGESSNTKSALLFEDIGNSYARGKLHLCVNNETNQNSATPADAKLTISNDGNVGIGTDAPGAKLVIATSGGSSTQLRLERADGAETGMIYMDSSDDLNIRNTGGSGNIILYPHPTSGNTIVNYGNVGIGTTSPTGKLNIQQSTLDIPFLFSGRHNSENEPILQMGESTEFSGSASYGELLIHSSNRDIVFSTQSEATFSNVDTAAMIIEKTNGNVGIGTDAPGSKLEINQNSSGTVYTKVINQNTGVSATARMAVVAESAQLDIIATSAGYTGVSGWADAGVISSDSGASGGLILNSVAGILKFQTNQTEKMRITSAGNIGIGTDEPDTKMQVAATGSVGLSVRSNTSGDAYMRLYSDANIEADWFIDRSASTVNFRTVNSKPLVFATNNTEAMRIEAGGNVGIGTDSPDATLQVDGNTNFGTAAQPANTSNFINNFNNDLAVLIRKIGTGSGDYLNIQDSTTSSKFIVKSAGNVGIGTDSPGAKLEVIGTATINSSVNSIGTIQSSTALNSTVLQLSSTYQQDIGQPAWNVDEGSYTNDSVTAPDGTTTGTSMTFTTTSYDLYYQIGGLGAADEGKTFKMTAWLKLGTATNFVMTPNNGAWNTLDSRSFDAEDGLNTSTWTQVTHEFVYTAGGRTYINFHIGANTGGAAQTAGTVFAWDWQFLEVSADDVYTPNIKLDGITGNDSYLNAGNVGIGVTGPVSKFEISQAQSDTMTDAEAFLSLKGTGGDGLLMGVRANTPYASWIQSGYVQNIGTSHNYPLALQPHGGNVGIGTTSPDNILTAKATNCTIDAQSTGDGQTISLRAGYLNSSGLAGYFRYTTGDAQLFIDNNYQGNNGVYSDINIRNRTTGNVLTTRIKIKGSTGNVGIGLTDPDSKLDVNAGVTAITAGPAVRISKGASPIGLIRYDTLVIEGNDVPTIRIGEAGTISTIMSGDSNMMINSTHPIKFYTAGTTTGEGHAGQGGTLAMLIDNSQNVGIGTTSPGAKLDIVGDGTNFALEVNNTSTGDAIKINTANATGNNGIYWNQGAVNLFNLFSTTSNDTRLRLGNTAGTKVHLSTNADSYLNGGNIGINTTAPLAKLDVRGTLRFDQDQDSGPGGTTGVGEIGTLIGDAGPDDTALGTPNKWLLINLSGNDYLIPAYSV